MTVLSDYVARMIAGGMDEAEAMQVAAEIFAAGVTCATKRSSSGALRTRKWRENQRHKASQNVTCDAEKVEYQNVTKRHKASQSVTSDNTPLSISKLDNRKRGARLSQDWSPSDEAKAFAKQLGWSDAQIDAEAANFRDYWIAKPGTGGCKLDWLATWRKWIRSSKVKPVGQSNVTSIDEHLDPEEAVKMFVRNGYWSRWAGPEPGMTGCRISLELFAKYGLLPDGRRIQSGASHGTR